jgi:hypothetical protein
MRQARRRACGSCQTCGRRERAHRSVQNRRRFRTAPTRLTSYPFQQNDEDQNSSETLVTDPQILRRRRLWLWLWTLAVGPEAVLTRRRSVRAQRSAKRCRPTPVGRSVPCSRSHATKPIDLGRRFALAMSLEVAEHLPPSAAETLVSSISRHSDIGLFSGPGQGGNVHLNEQRPDYWIRRFAVHEFQCFDRIRPLIWQNDRIST